MKDDGLGEVFKKGILAGLLSLVGSERVYAPDVINTSYDSDSRVWVADGVTPHRLSYRADLPDGHTFTGSTWTLTGFSSMDSGVALVHNPPSAYNLFAPYTTKDSLNSQITDGELFSNKRYIPGSSQGPSNGPDGRLDDVLMTFQPQFTSEGAKNLIFGARAIAFYDPNCVDCWDSDGNGNVIPPQPYEVKVVPPVWSDRNSDGLTDSSDTTAFETCATGPAIPLASGSGCGWADRDNDTDVDQTDFGYFQRCLGENGANSSTDCPAE